MNILNKLYSVGLLIVFAGIFSPTTVQSEEIPARGPIPLTVYDKDGNGLISEEEFNAVRADRMATKAAEGRRMRGAASAPSFSELDTSGDGQLTQEELAVGQRYGDGSRNGSRSRNGARSRNESRSRNGAR